MQIKRKNIVICSMILLLFIVGYAYNSFTSSKYASAKYDTQFSNIPIKDETAVTAEKDKDKTALKHEQDKVNINSEAKPGTEVAVIPETVDPEKDVAASSFFSEYRMERDKNRSKEVEMWQDIISSENAEKTFKNLAQQEIVKIVALTEKEMIIENLIMSRGFNDALVFLTDDSATVIVDAKELTKANIAQIQDIVVRKTKFNPNNIKIMKKN